MKLLEVHWRDAEARVDWHGRDELTEPPLVKTVGWQLKRTKRAIYLTMSQAGDPEDDQGYGPTFTIPRGMVVKEIVLGKK